FLISAVSVVIGLTLANTIRPGERVSRETAAQLAQRYGSDAQKRVQAAQTDRAATPKSPLMQVVETIVPANPLYAVSATETPQMLQLMFVALIVGVALTLVSAEVARPLLAVLEGIYAASAKIVDIVMQVAPFAVACL